MIIEELILRNPSGLHTRPAKRVAEAAKKYESSITIAYNGKEGDAKSLLKLMKLGVGGNGTISLRCEGSDEGDAAAAMRSVIASLEE